MRNKGIERRLQAIEKQSRSKKMGTFLSVTCPYTLPPNKLYVDEEPPCDECEHNKKQVDYRACVKYISPGKREQ